MVLASIQHSRNDESPDIIGDHAFSALLAQIDESNRAEFTNLVEDARTLYELRDENGPLTAEWPAGITRHVILDIGLRLVTRGVLDELEHVVDVSITELIGLLKGSEYLLAADADEAFERATPGDIIVTRRTVPTFNSVLAMAGGVVTEGGGLLSPTVVIARELGIPAVIGVAGALTDILDGAEIVLDPVARTVTVV